MSDTGHVFNLKYRCYIIYDIRYVRNLQARRALHALRGLVKLQALVRGHLVRKQTTATLRGMHALMSIQVRARIKRIKMAEEVIPPEISPPQHTESPCFEEYMTQPKQHQVSFCKEFPNVLVIMISIHLLANFQLPILLYRI